MKKQNVITGKVELTRKQNSTLGNPCYKAVVTTKEIEITGKTGSNYSFVYALNDHGYDKAVCYYHTTKAGNIIFTDIRPLNN